MIRRFIVLIVLIFGNFIVIAQPTVGLLHNSASAFKGYTLFAPVESKYTYLIDNCGEVINTWEGSKLPAYTVYLLEDASLLRVSNGLLERFNWSGELIWSADIKNDLSIRNHHDIEPLPNRNILVIAGEYFSVIEAIESGRNPAMLEDKASVDYIIELEPLEPYGAKIVWEWHFWDHLIQDFDDEKLNFGEVSKHPELLDINRGGSMRDWLHVNSIDYRADLDQILISSPYANELYIIDHSTTSEEAASHAGGNFDKGGDFLWRWGNPQIYKTGTEQDRKLFGQHDAKWIPAGYPNEWGISVFNNNFNSNASAVHIIASPTLADGSYALSENKFLPKDFSWTFKDEVLGSSFFNIIKSGIHVQPTGNALVSLGSGLFFEVTTTGQLVWAYQNPVVNDEVTLSQGSEAVKTEIFRVERYPENYAAFNNIEISSMGIIENENMLTENCSLISSITETKDLDEIEFNYQQSNNTIFISTSYNTVNLKIIDVQGRLWLFSDSEKIDISNLPNGIFYAIMSQPYFTTYRFCKM